MVNGALRSLWDEPRAPNPPARTLLDWVLAGVLVAASVGEALLHPDVSWRPLAAALVAAPALALLWRRSHPLAAVVVAFAAHAAVHLVPVVDHHATTLYATVLVLLFPYALLRWGSGREAVTGIAVILGMHAGTGAAESGGAAETAAGIAVLLLPAALGAAVRYRGAIRVREIDRVKLREREQLARELHDTVAHHVSAIAIQAQAGRTVAGSDPDAAVTALRTIEQEASRTLAEMRTIVGVLRRSEEPPPGGGAPAGADLAPQPGVAELARLARRASGAPVVELEPSGDLDDLTPSVDAAVYRLAQESITNALRHARRATRIRVTVAGERDCVRLTVTDDGEAGSGPNGSPSGYGIVGMTERAALLGGTLEAGPNRDRGWTVTAILPRTAPARCRP